MFKHAIDLIHVDAYDFNASLELYSNTVEAKMLQKIYTKWTVSGDFTCDTFPL